MTKFTPSNFTAEQAAAYVNATCVVVLSEMLSMHWDNEAVKQQNTNMWALGITDRFEPLPHNGQAFQDRMARHCVTHDNVVALFERAGR